MVAGSWQKKHNKRRLHFRGPLETALAARPSGNRKRQCSSACMNVVSSNKRSEMDLKGIERRVLVRNRRVVHQPYV